MNISSEHLTLQGKALSHPVLAAEISGGTDASCLAQLAHGYRLLSCWPRGMMEALGIHPQEPEEFTTGARYLFERAWKIEPHRQHLDQDQSWRDKKQARQVRLAQQPARVERAGGVLPVDWRAGCLSVEVLSRPLHGTRALPLLPPPDIV